MLGRFVSYVCMEYGGRATGASPDIATGAIKMSFMLELAFDAFDWVSRVVTRFESYHWGICFAVLLSVGFLCMRGLGVRGAR